MKAITVLLVEDHMMVREGLRKMLEREDDFEVVGEAQNGRLAVAKAKKLRPDVVLMDITMPVLNGLEATRQVLAAQPEALSSCPRIPTRPLSQAAAGWSIASGLFICQPLAVCDDRSGKCPNASPCLMTW